MISSVAMNVADRKALRTRRWHVAWATWLVGCAVALLGAGSAQAALVRVFNFGSNPGTLAMYKYVPAGLPAGAPLVVVMHGCTQTAAQIAVPSGWVQIADTYGIALVFPQTNVLNGIGACFNAYAAGDNRRDHGEALSIKQMVDTMKATHQVDASRVYATGLSAGAFMTNVMLAAYPDVFAGGAPNAGGPYRCADTYLGSLSCGLAGVDMTPQQWGDKVRGAYPGYVGPWPRVIVIHGASDNIVVPMNLEEQMEQWTNVHGIDQAPDAIDTSGGHWHLVYRDAAGVAQVETLLLQGLLHQFAIDPGVGPEQCGTYALSTADIDVCAAYRAARFWGIAP